MLPIPFNKYIPSFFKRDDKLDALANKTDEMLEEWKQDVLKLNYLINPVRIDSSLLNELGSYLNAGLSDTDTDRQKRQKIKNAIEGHKNRGTWLFDVKPKIDTLIGGDSEIFRSTDSTDFVLLGYESDDPNNYWATMGIDGIDDDLGTSIIGAGDEIEIAGNIYIDVDSSTLTFKEVENIKTTIEDSVPAYYVVYLGYVVGGQFVTYINGVIGVDTVVVFAATSYKTAIGTSSGKKLVAYVEEN